MEKNDFLEKIKRNWKKILIIGGISYVALTLISTAVGAAFITKRGKQIENCEDEIGRDFQARKADFLEKYYDNWDKGLQKMSEGFARTQKISDRDQIKGFKSSVDNIPIKIKKLQKTPGNKAYIETLEKQLNSDLKNLEIFQSVFDKKWTPQKENESLEEYERRKDEALVDWYVIQVNRKIDDLEWYPDQREKTLEYIEEEKEYLTKAQANFLTKYGEEYPKINPPNLCNL